MAGIIYKREFIKEECYFNSAPTISYYFRVGEYWDKTYRWSSINKKWIKHNGSSFIPYTFPARRSISIYTIPSNLELLIVLGPEALKGPKKWRRKNGPHCTKQYQTDCWGGSQVG
jgi:hypothetical protein